MADQKQRLEALHKFVESFDEKAFKNVDLDKHAVVSIERDAHTADTHMVSHVNVRKACDYLAAQVGQGYQPEFLVNLDTGERVDVSLTAFVVPTNVDGVGLLLPRATAVDLLASLKDADSPVLKQAATIIKRSLTTKEAS